MRRAIRLRVVVAVVGLLGLGGCGGGAKKSGGPVAVQEVKGTAPEPEDLKDEIPGPVMEETLEAHFAGLGHMERFEYGEAAEEFGKVRKLAPGWIAGSINLAIALLNQTGQKIEESEGQGPEALTNFDEALILLDGVLARDARNPYAHFCKGIILEQVGDWREAHDEFGAATEIDPDDAHSWYWFGATMPGEDGRDLASIKDAELIIPIYEKALACNPYLVPAYYRLQQAYGWARKRDKQKELLETHGRLNPQRQATPPGPGDDAVKAYGLMGKYASVVGPKRGGGGASEGKAPVFGGLKPMDVALAEGDRWTTPADFEAEGAAVLGRYRKRAGAGMAAFDADRDGRLDLYLTAAVVGPDGLRDALLLNKGDGKFEDATAAAGLPAGRASLGVAAGDFDADMNIDLYLAGVGGSRLFRGLGGGRFEDVTEATGTGEGDAICPTARWLDLDQDGDLDLIVVRHASSSDAATAFGPEPPAGLPLAAYRNDGRPSAVAGPEGTWAPLAVESPEMTAVAGLNVKFTPWPDAAALVGEPAANVALAATDLDADRDLDLVIAADGKPLRVVWNERLGRFASESLAEPVGMVSNLLVGDFDRDGRSELLATGGAEGTLVLRNAAIGRSNVKLEAWPSDAKGWRAATLGDVDLDGWIDVVGLPSVDGAVPEWARNDGRRLTAAALPIAPPTLATSGFSGVQYVDLLGSPLPEFIAWPAGQGPSIAENRGNGHRWLGLRLGGRWGVTPKLMRTNVHGIGTKLALEGAGVSVPHEQTTPEAGPAQSVAPFVLGLGDAAIVPLVRLTWPDGVMQCEMNKVPDQVLELAEYNRKTGSCPVLFTWDGTRFVCIGDFLGGGGLGYMVAPGVYGQPDRDEAVAIRGDQLAEVDGVYRLSITEPMDEVAYLDQLVLEVVDRPAGVDAHPDERFAPGGNRPTGELHAWRRTIEPARATDLEGRDVSAKLLADDRDTVDGFKRRLQWVGYAEEHGLVLDFGDRLASFGEHDRLILCLAGWVEYPYSQTNYAAATAGVDLAPPVLERRNEDGSWSVLEADPGYPAGLPRMTTLELTGKLGGARCVLRLRTNMECYWDRAFVAVEDSAARNELRVASIPVSRAVLGNRGYSREVSPDGRLPLIYDYDYVDPAPLAPFLGMLTRYGDVADLLRADDDRLCLVGPGDEVRLEFDAAGLAPLSPGWMRGFVLRTIGYCKDADPFTAGSDEVGPLPWKGMPDYPFAAGVRRPSDAGYEEYLRTYQTRSAGR